MWTSRLHHTACFITEIWVPAMKPSSAWKYDFIRMSDCFAEHARCTLKYIDLHPWHVCEHQDCIHDMCHHCAIIVSGQAIILEPWLHSHDANTEHATQSHASERLNFTRWHSWEDHCCAFVIGQCCRSAPENLSDGHNSCIFTHRNYVYTAAMCISQRIWATDNIDAFLHIATM